MSTVVLGYTCACGEPVKVFELQVGKANHLPVMTTVSCRKGHITQFRSPEISLLDVWGRDVSDAKLSNIELRIASAA